MSDQARAPSSPARPGGSVRRSPPGSPRPERGSLAIDRDADTLDGLAGRIGAGAELHRVVADVRFRPRLEPAVASALDIFGRLDILVNNAGRWARSSRPIPSPGTTTWPSRRAGHPR